MMTIPTNLQIDQDRRRARDAKDTIAAVKTQMGNSADKFKSLAQSAPAAILASGLGQVISFWKAKGEEHHRLLYARLTGWLVNQGYKPDEADLLDWIIGLEDMGEYELAVNEALAWLNWVKRFAESEIA